MTEKILTREIAKQYVQACVHYGHTPKEWNPKMAPYLLTIKYGYHIFDLVKTSKFLKLAGKVVEKKAEKGGKFLFVGTNKVSSILVEQQAKRVNSYYINYRWLGGMLTNWSTIQKRIERLKTLEMQEGNGTFETLSKKEISKKKKEIEKLKRLFDGIKTMSALPDLVIFTNQLKDSLAIKECLLLGIPTVAIVDSNGDPDMISYFIPGNDDSSSSVHFILTYLGTCILNGQQKRNEK